MKDDDGGMPRDATGMALRKLVATGSDLSRPMELEFVVVVPDEMAGEYVAQEAVRAGYLAELSLDSETGELTCICAKTFIPDYDAVVAAEVEVDEIGRRHGGYGDGFGSPGNATVQ